MLINPQTAGGPYQARSVAHGGGIEGVPPAGPQRLWASAALHGGLVGRAIAGGEEETGTLAIPRGITRRRGPLPI